MAASAKTLASETHTLDGDWTIVLPRHGKKKRNFPKLTTLEQQAWVPPDLTSDPIRESKLIQKIHICMDKVKNSQFYHNFMDQIETKPVLDSLNRFLGPEPNIQMVLYGIGSIESYENPRLQLCLAILIKRKFNWIESIDVFDPVLSAAECRALEALGCSVLSVNEQGRRKAIKPTLFFMPHCEAELYNNLLQENWRVDLLNNVVLFGNSFETYEWHASLFKSSSVAESSRYIAASRRFAHEFRIKIGSEFYNAFHDSSWHFFSPVLETELQDTILVEGSTSETTMDNPIYHLENLLKHCEID